MLFRSYLHLERTFFIGKVNSIKSGIRFESELKKIQETENRIQDILNSEGKIGIKLEAYNEWGDIQNVFRQRNLRDAQVLSSQPFYIPEGHLDERQPWAVVQGSSSVFFSNSQRFDEHQCLHHDLSAKHLLENCDKAEEPTLKVAKYRQNGLFFGTPFHCRENGLGHRTITDFNRSGCLLMPIFQTKEAPNFCCGHCRFYEQCPADKNYKCTKPLNKK